MNSTQAKQLSLPEIMSRLGYRPVKMAKGGREVWYKSPFRDENDPSFHTSHLGGKWIWNDFGDTGGTVIDFVMRHENLGSVKDALAFLDRMFQGHIFNKAGGGVGDKPSIQPDFFSFQQQPDDPPLSFDTALPDPQLEFIEAFPIRSPIIHSYLQGRGIGRALADLYLQEVRYRNLKNGKEYFAFGMKNESGGYEIRVATASYSFKSALIARDITLVRGTMEKQGAVNVFEGMADFLSLLAMLKVKALGGDAIIMHSLSSFGRTTNAIQKGGYQTINTFLDNDRAGEEHSAKFKELFGEKVTDQRGLFAPHNDLNAALIAPGFPGLSLA